MPAKAGTNGWRRGWNNSLLTEPLTPNGERLWRSSVIPLREGEYAHPNVTAI